MNKLRNKNGKFTVIEPKSLLYYELIEYESFTENTNEGKSPRKRHQGLVESIICEGNAL